MTERDYPLLTPEQLTVWSEQHPAPAGGDDFERKLLKWWHDDAQAQLAKKPDDGAAWQSLIGWSGPVAVTVEKMQRSEVTGGGKNWRAVTGVLAAADGRFALPVMEIRAEKADGPQVLWLDERGKAGLFNAEGEARPEVVRLLEAGVSVAGVDLFGQGEFQAEGQPPITLRRTKNPREAAAFTFGYNPAVFAHRVHDVATVLGFGRSGESSAARKRGVVALDGTGPIAAVALALLPTKIDRAVLQTGGFRFGSVLDLQSPGFLPAAAKYGDLPGALTLARQQADRFLVLGEGEKNEDPIGWLLEKADR